MALTWSLTKFLTAMQRAGVDPVELYGSHLVPHKVPDGNAEGGVDPVVLYGSHLVPHKVPDGNAEGGVDPVVLLLDGLGQVAVVPLNVLQRHLTQIRGNISTNVSDTYLFCTRIRINVLSNGLLDPDPYSKYGIRIRIQVIQIYKNDDKINLVSTDLYSLPAQNIFLVFMITA